MANRSCYERVAIFSNMFEIIVTPFRTLANEAIVQRISYRAIRDTPYVRKPIRKCVRALLTLVNFKLFDGRNNLTFKSLENKSKP